MDINDDNSLLIDPVRSFLAQARAIFELEYNEPNNTGDESERPVINTFFGLYSQAYLFSYMAINAYTNAVLISLWNREKSPLKKEYPKINDIDKLLWNELGEVREALKVLCKLIGIDPLHQARPLAWNNLIQTLLPVRNYLMHPKTDKASLEKISKTITANAWAFPSDIAVEIISHFYSAQKQPIPSWLSNNEDYKIKRIEIFDKNPDTVNINI